MTASKDFVAYVMELLEPVAAIEGSRLFGGYGIRSGATQFAMIMSNCLYFVVDDNTRPKYERLNKKPFSYTTKNGQRFVKRYYEVPEDLLEDSEALQTWAKESIAIAKATSKRK